MPLPHPRVELHIAVDNYAADKHPDVQAWLARHPRITLHFTPPSGSWRNMEIFFGIITRQGQTSCSRVAAQVREVRSRDTSRDVGRPGAAPDRCLHLHR